MISTVRAQLATLGKSDCEHQSLHYQEKGKGVRLTPPTNGEAIKIKVDTYLITENNTKKCDCSYFYQSSTKRYAFLVELKGSDYRTALEQLSVTKQHNNYSKLLAAANPCTEYGVVILSKNTNTNRPNKELWEEENGMRLRVFACADNTTIDLFREIIREPEKD